MPRVAEPIKNGKTLDARITQQLTDMADAGKSRQFKITVGGHPPGLMLQVTPAGTSSWLLRTTVNGKRREIGLGAYRRGGAGIREAPSISLSQARDLAEKFYDSIGQGVDPVAERAKARERKQTFKDVAEAFLDENEAGWRNAKHRQQWRNTLETYAYPKIGDVPVATLDKSAVKAVLMQPVEKAGGEPLWTSRYETATRLRQRIEKVCRWARAHGYLESENPALWRDGLAEMMPQVADEIAEVVHHAALPYEAAAAFMADLRQRKGTAARALEFLILTAARSGEVRGATWDEIDLDLRLWTIPRERMKKRKQHTVPLSDAALAILINTPESRRHPDHLIFPGAKRDPDTGLYKTMSDMTLTAVLRRMGRGDLTAHGFRSTFRDWGGEVSSHPERVLENALAHQLDDKTAAAYARGKQLDKRIAVMRDWAAYLAGAV